VSRASLLAELQGLIDEGRSVIEIETWLVDRASAAYEKRNQTPVLTLRCGIAVAGRKSCGRRAGFIFATPDGPIFSNARRTDGAEGEERTLFLFHGGLLTIQGPDVQAPFEKPVIAGYAPYLRCSSHGLFPVAKRSLVPYIKDARAKKSITAVIRPPEGWDMSREALLGAQGELGHKVRGLANAAAIHPPTETLY
jgi:hypothetical protein